MPVGLARLPSLILLCLVLAGCGDEATLPVEAGTGPDPELPPPVQSLLPTVVLAHAKGWPDGDGVAETRSALLKGLNSPFGMALIGDRFYVANTDSVVRFPYEDGATKITEKGEKIAGLPAGPLNLH